MLVTEFIQAIKQPLQNPLCTSCNKELAQIEMHGFADKTANLLLCADCAMQLARKLMEDLCALITKSGRHG